MTEATKPDWDEYAHIYIMGINDKFKGETSEFENPLHTRIYNYGRGVGNPPAFDANKHNTP